MPEISMLDLRANLTTVLQRVEAGESFTVRRFGTTIASIEPVVTQTEPTDASAPSHRKAAVNDPLRAKR